MPDPSTLSGFITYLLYLIPIATAIMMGWVQLIVQTRVQISVYKHQEFSKRRDGVLRLGDEAVGCLMDTLLILSSIRRAASTDPRLETYYENYATSKFKSHDQLLELRDEMEKILPYSSETIVEFYFDFANALENWDLIGFGEDEHPLNPVTRYIGALRNDILKGRRLILSENIKGA